VVVRLNFAIKIAGFNITRSSLIFTVVDKVILRNYSVSHVSLVINRIKLLLKFNPTIVNYLLFYITEEIELQLENSTVINISYHFKGHNFAFGIGKSNIFSYVVPHSSDWIPRQ